MHTGCRSPALIPSPFSQHNCLSPQIIIWTFGPLWSPVFRHHDFRHLFVAYKGRRPLSADPLALCGPLGNYPGHSRPFVIGPRVRPDKKPDNGAEWGSFFQLTAPPGGDF